MSNRKRRRQNGQVVSCVSRASARVFSHMAKDLTPILKNFGIEPGSVRARKINTPDGQIFLQLRMDLGLLQMTVEGRPDGSRPCGQASLLESVQHRLAHTSAPVELSQDELGELVREML